MALPNEKNMELKIAKAKAKVQKMEALFNEKKRKERTSQLVAAGVLLEMIYREDTLSERQEWLGVAKINLKNNPSVLKRVIAFFKRLDDEYPVQNIPENA